MNGLRADTSIKYHISPQLWNMAKGRALENSREGKEVNRMLEAVGFNIMQVRRQLESEGVARHFSLCSRKTSINVWRWGAYFSR